MNKKNILLLLGPNLNMVGIREKGVYGEETAEDIARQVKEYAKGLGWNCDVYQLSLIHISQSWLEHPWMESIIFTVILWKYGRILFIDMIKCIFNPAGMNGTTALAALLM